MKTIALALTLLAAGIQGACSGGEGGEGGVAPGEEVNLIHIAQSGGVSGVKDSMELMLIFDVDPVTLTADDISVTGAVKGALASADTMTSVNTMPSGSTMTSVMGLRGYAWFLAISNISVGNGETVSVRISSPAGYSISGSPQNVVVYRAPHVGMAYQGGKIAYILQSGDPGYVAGETHGFIAATADLSDGIQWYNGSYGRSGGAGKALGTGQANTTAIVSTFGDGSYAAKLCADYTNADTGTGVYSD